MKRMVLLMMLLLLSGCLGTGKAVDTQTTPTSIAGGPVDERQTLLLFPYRSELATLNPATNQVERTIPLGRFSAYYAIAPNGKVYMPLHENPGDRQTYVGVLDRQSGVLRRIATGVGAMMRVEITRDGTAFVDSGSVQEEKMLIAVLDTAQEKLLGTIAMPGHVKWITAYSQTEALVAVNKPSGMGGNLYLINRRLERSEPLLPFDMEPFAPNQVIRPPGSKLLYSLYAGFPPTDTGRREQLRAKLTDPRLVDAHIDIWDLEAQRLQRRIYLPLPSAQHMVLGPDGRLYVGHIEMKESEIDEISVVQPDTGEVLRIKTVRSPGDLLIQGDRLYIASQKEPEVDILEVPAMKRIARVRLTGIPALPPLSLP